MKTYLKVFAIMSVLALVVTTQAQTTVIGSWLSAPIPPTPANDEGWQRGQGGFGADGSIFASSNYPAYFQLKPNIVAGYAQSLDIHETGYGQDRLYISLSPSQIAAFTNNTQLTFTFSCDSSTNEGGITAGYLQLVQFQCNSDGGGFQQPAISTAGGFSETGDTNNNSGGQPVFDFYSGSPARSQVVTWNYGSALPASTNSSSYVQFVFIFQSGGGAPTNIYINNVTLTTPPSTINVDQFDPTNNPYAGTNIYDSTDDEITNVYNLWTGYGGNTAVDPDTGGILWDPTVDSTGNTNSGSLKITASFTNDNQFLVWNRGPGNTFSLNPPITNGYGLVSFHFDVKYDSSSPTATNGSVVNYGHLEWGVVPNYSAATVLGSVDVNVTNTGWTHVDVPLTPQSDSDLLNISGFYFKQYSGYYGGITGTSTLWIDNLYFTYAQVAPLVPPPTMAIQKATPALRIFAGSTGTINDRESLVSTGTGQSWIGGSYPVNYSFTLLSYPSSINQTHIMLIPTTFLGADPHTGYNGLDYSFATNLVWMTLNPGPSNGTVVVNIQWKTNLPSANANQTALTYTNTGVLGKWTLQFTSAGGGNVIAPDNSSHPFTIADPNISTDFANPMASYFGLQPNSNAGEGQYEDWGAISVSGVSDGNINEDFTHESSDFNPSGTANGISPSGYFEIFAAAPAGVVITTTNSSDANGYWVNWTLPATGYNLGTKTNLLQIDPWINPAYYSAYNDETAPRGLPVQLGQAMWTLLPSDDLPTVDGLQNSIPSPTAFFLVGTNNVVSP